MSVNAPWSAYLPHQPVSACVSLILTRERDVLFIGTQFSNLYTMH